MIDAWSRSVADPSTMASDISREGVIANRLPELAVVERWLAEIADDWGLPPKTAFAIDLVINEAVTNVVSYGYRDNASDTISISLTNQTDAVDVEIIDSGAAFNPLDQPPMEIGADLEHADIGGRGIHLIRTYSQGQSYGFVSGRNHLKLRINKQS
jgi:anti-sigma regulatory factor (Ser/Thr protein kinase)